MDFLPTRACDWRKEVSQHADRRSSCQPIRGRASWPEGAQFISPQTIGTEGVPDPRRDEILGKDVACHQDVKTRLQKKLVEAFVVGPP